MSRLKKNTGIIGYARKFKHRSIIYFPVARTKKILRLIAPIYSDTKIVKVRVVEIKEGKK